MPERFSGKVVVVTGGSSGMGLAVAERLAAEGASVVIGARGAEAGERAAAAVGGLFVPTDVTVESDVARLIGSAVGEYGRLDGAFNNAGGTSTFDPIDKLGDAAWRAELDLNLSSVFYGLKYQIPAIRNSGGGSIVNNASLLGVVGSGNLAAYTAAKHGVVGLSRAAALECAAEGIRVNALITHAVDTPLLRRLLGGDPAGFAGSVPVGRLAEPSEVAAFVAFLLSDEAGFVTGAALPIDGGVTAQ
jgi:NAD(P)-dependent dehydrogenase (short-subunit alcohol dehydrogenase family)